MLEFVQNAAVYVGAFLGVLTLVAFVHEFGHYQVARWFKVKVDTFCVLGWGKTILSVRDKSGVKWGVAPFPIGAYVSFVDDAETYGPGLLQVDDPAKRGAARRDGVLRGQSPAVKTAVSLGGPTANFVFSIAAFALLFLIVGKDVTDLGALPARVDQVQAESPAAKAGLEPGDVVVAVDGVPVASFSAFQETIAGSAGQALRLDVLRDGGKLTLTATPEARDGVDAAGARITRGALGIGRSILPEERVVDRLNPLEAIAAGAEQCWRIIATTGAYVGNVFAGRADADQIAGPAGILDMSGKVAKGALGAEGDLGARAGALALALLTWAATLSVAVGIVNLLPVPVLDGGHVVFYGIEALRRGKPLSERSQIFAMNAGVLMIAALFLFATWNDIQRFIG